MFYILSHDGEAGRGGWRQRGWCKLREGAEFQNKTILKGTVSRNLSSPVVQLKLLLLSHQTSLQTILIFFDYLQRYSIISEVYRCQRHWRSIRCRCHWHGWGISCRCQWHRWVMLCQFYCASPVSTITVKPSFTSVNDTAKFWLRIVNDGTCQISTLPALHPSPSTLPSSQWPPTPPSLTVAKSNKLSI
jgi:hypothetical protein